MLINKSTAVHTEKVSLVPYSKHHVAKYHGWMQDPDIQAATASEPLSLEAEYEMQRSWRQDNDKLTFIICLPQNKDTWTRREDETCTIGDVNLFISVNEEDSGDLSLLGEIELMIAEKIYQHRGMGRAALLTFLNYILRHEKQILNEYFSTPRDMEGRDHLDYFRVKISESNARSIGLFESSGFTKVGSEPNWFGEYELRSHGFTVQVVEQVMEAREVRGYTEASYPEEDVDIGNP